MLIMYKKHMYFSVATYSVPNKNKKCVPFVSQYTDCNDDNLCSGCTRCSCNAQEEWDCEKVMECDSEPNEYDNMNDEDEIFDHALEMLQDKMDKNTMNDMKKSKYPNEPMPRASLDQSSLLESVKMYRMDEIVSSLMRPRRSPAKNTSKHKKRSVDKTSHRHAKTTNSGNNTIKFYETVDELNEDTLKNTNITGTLTAAKVDIAPKIAISRRSNDVDNSSKALRIDFNQPKEYHQITDNKIEAMESEIKFDQSHENLKSVLGNYTQNVKDKDLSKIVVNELKKGKEVIGDANAPVTSNITFTPENDTLTAMAFIAGNLLNKLWNMEKDASGSSVETDAIKHEKITDLLDLFKEPLNLRQETFLKNALEQLSTALDKHKDVKNISLCDNIEEAKKVLYDTNSTSEEARDAKPKKTKIEEKESCKKNKTKSGVEKQKMATVKAIAKINNVLELIKKFENIQESLSELKHGPKLDFNLNHTSLRSGIGQPEANTKLTNDERNSLNLFGNLLEKITKLIMPKRNSKRIVNRMKSQSMFVSDDVLKKKFKKLYNIDLTNMTVTAKDKIILDYLTHVEGNPDCLLKNNNHKISTPISKIEGDILLNLSEFFKMKSFSDLINLLEPEKRVNLRTEMETTSHVETTTVSGVKKVLSSDKDVETQTESKKFNSTKDKLKAHLKTIIEDLIELQNAKGGNIKNNIKIADALPCIYNVLKAGQDDVTTKKLEPKKIADIFHDLKKEIKASQSRRNSGDILTIRPKSAIVWERLVKTLNDQSGLKSRRSLPTKVPKTYDQIKVKMDRIENGSSSYKHYALLVPVAPAGRLMLLKSLEQDAQSAIDIIDDIQLSLENLSKLPADKFADLEEFVGNLATRINLSVKVDEKIKPELRKYFVNDINSGYKITRNKLKKKPSGLRFSETRSEETDEMKVSRNQIINQLIRNRMQLFIKLKEEREFDVEHDVNYKIAQRVIYYLDTGNYDLAKELFRVFVAQKQINSGIFSNTGSTKDTFVATSTQKVYDTPIRRMASPRIKPLIEFEDQSRRNPTNVNWVNQDHLIKQLLNIKNMRM